MRAIRLQLLTLALAASLAAGAEETITIVDHITAVGGNTVEHPDALRRRLVKVEDTADEETRDETVVRPQNGRMAGYRVQVFSDNNPRTAKAEAGRKKRLVDSRFPQYQTRVSYNSPYWRVRVGDFRTQQEANSAADELRRAFPTYSKEIRVVRDRISVSGN